MAAPKNPNREAAAKGGRNSSRKGIPNKRSQELIDRLGELGCDPLELSAKIAMGQELDGPHPAVGEFRRLVHDLQNAIDGKGDDPTLFPDRLDALINDHLLAGYVPIELRSKHIVDLMQYSHHKLKAIDHTTGGNELPNLVQVYMPANGRDLSDG